MSYALHHPALGPDNFDWAALRKRRKNPPHVASTYLAVKAMAEPQVKRAGRHARAWAKAPGETSAENKNPVCCCYCC